MLKKVVLGCFFTSKSSEIIHNSIFQMRWKSNQIITPTFPKNLEATMMHRLKMEITTHLVTYLVKSQQFFSAFWGIVQFYLLFNWSYVTCCAVMRYVVRILNQKSNFFFQKYISLRNRYFFVDSSIAANQRSSRT